MITIPVYELLSFTGSYIFSLKKDMFPEGRIKEQNIGEEILFCFTEERNSPRGNFHGKYFSSGRDGNH